MLRDQMDMVDHVDSLDQLARLEPLVILDQVEPRDLRENKVGNGKLVWQFQSQSY